MSQLTIKYERGEKVMLIDGQPATQAEVDAKFPPKPFEAPMTTMAWDSSRGGLKSRSGGVTKKQAASLRKFLEERKVRGAEVDANGDVHFRTRGARNDYLRARGLIDQDGSYGDRT